LEFTTQDSTYTGVVDAILRYRIIYPYDAFVAVADVHGDVIRQARATLGDILRRLTVESMSLVPPGVDNKFSSSYYAEGGSAEPSNATNLQHESYASWVSQSFHKELESVVIRWGVGDVSLRIESLTPSQETRALLQERAKIRMQTATGSAVAKQQFENAMSTTKREQQVRLAEAEMSAQTMVIATKAKAEALMILAVAKANALVLSAEAERKQKVLEATSEYDASMLRLKFYRDSGFSAEMMMALEFGIQNTRKAGLLANAESSTMVFSADLDLSGTSAISQAATQLTLADQVMKTSRH